MGHGLPGISNQKALPPLFRDERTPRYHPAWQGSVSPARFIPDNGRFFRWGLNVIYSRRRRQNSRMRWATCARRGHGEGLRPSDAGLALSPARCGDSLSLPFDAAWYMGL